MIFVWNQVNFKINNTWKTKTGKVLVKPWTNKVIIIWTELVISIIIVNISLILSFYYNRSPYYILIYNYAYILVARKWK